MRVEDFGLLLVGDDRVLEAAFALDLFAEEGLLPLVGEALVLFVYVILMCDGLQTALVELAEELAEGLLRLAGQQGLLLRYAQQRREELQVLLMLN